MIKETMVWESLLEECGWLHPIRSSIHQAMQRVLDGVPEARGILSPDAENEMMNQLRKRVQKIFLAPMIMQLKESMDPGDFMEHVVLADTVSPELCAAVERCAGEGLAPVYTRYPVLRSLERSIPENFVAAQTEFLRRYLDSRELLSRRFFGGKEAGKILRFLNSAGDATRHGRLVTGVACEGGHFYYKPHDCRVDAFFHGLVQDLFSDFTVAPDVITGDGFGFCTELVPKPVRSEEEVGRYFRNYGAVIALNVALNGRDLHRENILACGEYPAMIDLESLMCSQIRNSLSGGKTPAEQALEKSVLQIGVLPHRDYLDQWMDSPLHWAPGQTDDNLPRCNGKTFVVTGYEDSLIEGFRLGYERMRSGREMILKGIQSYPGMIVRSMYNIPRFLQTLLDQMLRPENLTSGEKQREVLEKLRFGAEETGKTTNDRITNYEAGCLREGEVAYYCVNVFSRDLCGVDADEILSENELAESPFEGVEKRFEALSEKDLEMQERMIRTTLRHMLTDDSNEFLWKLKPEETALKPEMLRSQLGVLIDQLWEECIRAEDGTPFWLSAEMEWTKEKNCGLTTIQADVTALCGTALEFLPEGEQKRRAEKMLIRCLGSMEEKLSLWENAGSVSELPPGMRYGAAGVLRGFFSAEKAGVPGAMEMTDRMVRFLAERKPCAEQNPGLGQGMAGLLYALAALHRRKNANVERLRLEETARLADRLTESAAAEPFSGENNPFEGGAGIGAALAAAAAALNTDRYDSWIEDAFAAVRANWNESIQGWKSSRGVAIFEKGPYTAGIGLCALQALANRPEIRSGSAANVFELALQSELRETGLLRRDVPENGNALRVFFLIRAEEIFPYRGAGERAGRILGEMIGRKETYGQFIVSQDGLRNSFDPSLMTGSTGIGMVMLLFDRLKNGMKEFSAKRRKKDPYYSKRTKEEQTR